MSNEIGKQTAPFTMFSSSADGGYLTDLHANFKEGVEINNLHADEYGEIVGAPIQGPYTYQWVGGHQHRHQEALSTTDRGEAFHIRPGSSAIKVYGADYPDANTARAVLARDGLAKRALNIANLRTTTGSLSQGNYDHNIQVIQTSGKTQNPRHFAENSEVYQQFPERRGNESEYISSFPENLFKTTSGPHFGLVSRYTESFESNPAPSTNPGNPGSWINGAGSLNGSSIANGRRWQSDVNDTASGNTGPTGPHHGGKYFFTEASGDGTGFPNKYFTLKRSLTSSESLELQKLSVYYHMFGGAMGQLQFLTSSDGTTFTQLLGKVTKDADAVISSPTPGLDSISGGQHVSSGSAWHRAEVDLSEQSGQSFWIMIAGYSGTGYTSDIAIDKIEFIYPEPAKIDTIRNFTLPSGSANKSIITNRFSAPGDRYTMSRGFLNPSGEEMSVYNTLPYRNENVRQNLRERLTRHMSAQGYEVSGSTITTTGSFHKINRNTLRQLKGGEEGTTVTTGSQYDNFFVQHPIPRSDLAYAWVTASLGSDAMDSLYGYATGSSDISFNLPQKDFTERTLFDYNPTTNTTLLPLAATGPVSGAYGFSSWEAMRRTDYKSTRYIRDNNLFSFWTSDNKTYANTTVVTQSAVTSKYKPIQHTATITGDESNTPFTFRSTYSNDLNYFGEQKSTDVEAKLGLYKDDDETFYATVKGYYIQPESDNTNNPFGTVNKVRVSETVYPKDKSAYTVGTRARSNYTEAAGTGENGYDRQYGKQNTFYHSTKTRSDDTENSFGFTSTENTILEQTTSFSFGQDLVLPTSLQSRHSHGLMLDASSGSVAFKFGGVDERANQVRTLQPTFEISGSTSISMEYVRGNYAPLSLPTPASGKDLFIQYQDNGDSVWKTSTISDGTISKPAIISASSNIGNSEYASLRDYFNRVEYTTRGSAYNGNTAAGDLAPGSSYGSYDTSTGNFYFGDSLSTQINKMTPDRTFSVFTYSPTSYVHSVDIDKENNKFYWTEPTDRQIHSGSLSDPSDSGVILTTSTTNLPYNISVSGTIVFYTSRQSSPGYVPNLIYYTDTSDSTPTAESFDKGTAAKVEYHNPTADIDYFYRLKFDFPTNRLYFAGNNSTNTRITIGYYENPLTNPDPVILNGCNWTVTNQQVIDMSLDQDRRRIYLLVNDTASPYHSYLYYVDMENPTTPKLQFSEEINIGSFSRIAIMGFNPYNLSTLAITMDTSPYRALYNLQNSDGTTALKLSSSVAATLLRQDGSMFDKGTKLRIAQTSHNGNAQDNFAIRNLTLSYNEYENSPKHKTFFPLETSGVKSFPLSGSYEGKTGELLVDKDESAYISNPTPSQCFVESTSLVKDGILSDYLERTTNTLAGVSPWEDSYDNFREDFRGLAKDMSVLPEFKISDHLDEYYTDFNFAKPPTDYLTLQGGDIAKGEVIDTGTENFFDRFTTSEPLRDYKQFLEDHAEEGLEIKSMKIKVDTVKKLLPYNGFYPMTRTVQLGNLLSASFIENVTGKEKGVSGFDTQGFQAISKTLMSPGILYNSIKAGYGVSYPIYKTTPTTKMDTRAVDKNVYEDFHIESTPDYQIPFDALLNPKGNIPENEDIIFTPSWTSTTPAAPAYDYSGQWNGTAKPQFQLGMHNFLAETVKFFLKDEQLVSHVSEPQKEGFDVEAGKTYYMDVVLRDNIKMDRMGTYSGTVTSSAESYLNNGTVQWDACSGSDGFYMVTRESNPYESQIQGGFPPRISMYRRTLDAEPWELLDRFTLTQQNSTDSYRSPIAITSGSSEIYVAFNSGLRINATDETTGNKIRVYKFKQGKYEQDTYDTISPYMLLTPNGNDRFSEDIKIEASANGYHLLTNYYTNAGFSFNITSSAGMGDSTTSVSVGAKDRVLMLFESSSAGLSGRNIFHNVTPNYSTTTTTSAGVNLGFAHRGTFDMVSASYTDVPGGFTSSSMGGIIISAGYYMDSGSVGSNQRSGSMNLYYSGSNYGTASLNYQNPNPPAQYGYYGYNTAICNNSTGPNRKFYFLASTLKQTGNADYNMGAVHFHTGTIVLNGTVPEFGAVGKTFIFNNAYLTASSYNAANEVGAAGKQDYDLSTIEAGWGSTMDIVSSNPTTDGQENKVYAVFSNPSYEYKHTSHTRHSGSLVLITMSGSGYVRDPGQTQEGNMTHIPTYAVDSSMSEEYVYSNGNSFLSLQNTTTAQTAGRSTLVLISSSVNRYNTGDNLIVFSSDSLYPNNRVTGLPDAYNSSYGATSSIANSNRTHIVMHTGSAYIGTGYGKTYSSANTRNVNPNFSASIQITSDFTYRKDGALYGQPVENAYDPAYSAYTPPSFYGTSVARISYTAPEYGGKVSLPEIFRDSTVQEIFELDTNRSAKFYSKTNKMTTLQKSAKMPLSSSVTLFGARIPRVDNAFDPRDVQWVVGSKFESPVLDFAPNDTAHSSSYTARNQALMNSLNFIDNASHLPPRSMWTSYGSIPSNEKGITLEVKESYDQGILNSPTTGSLVELCGFKAQSKKMGQVSTSKEISEAIVLIPYVKGGFGPSGIGNGSKAMKRAFKFANSSAEVSTRSANIKQFTNSHSFIPIKASTFNSQFKKLQDGEDPETTITKMIQGMEKYILPPHMDFLKAYKKNDNKWTGSPLLPFGMYFIEVDHDLDQEDLLNIWQGVMPKIARDFDGEEMSQVLEHDIDEDNLFHKPDLLKRAIKQDLSFMVFKVKQRAEANYFNVTKDSIDDMRYQFDFDGDGIREAVPEYSYNWPYDFFSLIETAKVTIDLDLEEIPEPVVTNTVVPPPPFRTLRPTRTLRPRDRIQRGRLQRTRIKQKVKRKLNKPRASVRDKINTGNRPKPRPRIRGVR